MIIFIGLIVGLLGTAVAVSMGLAFARALGLYTTVDEGTCKVFVLFGKVLGVLSEPGLSFPVASLGPGALLIPFFGKIHTIDIRLDQEYLRSQPVNSEEGTPMGVGVWYEMRVTDPVDFLFKNNDPRGSLRANVSNAAVRCLSNMPLEDLLEDRHMMSQSVRADVSPKSEEWGYRLGSVYIRKVHFRDETMLAQIQQKVANRLLQVTSAIRQAGANQVDVIKSAADKEAAQEFARAQAMRPQIVGETLSAIAATPDVTRALLEILEIERLRKSKGKLTLVPQESSLIADLLAANSPTAEAGLPSARMQEHSGTQTQIPPAPPLP